MTKAAAEETKHRDHRSRNGAVQPYQLDMLAYLPSRFSIYPPPSFPATPRASPPCFFLFYEEAPGDNRKTWKGRALSVLSVMAFQMK